MPILVRLLWGLSLILTLNSSVLAAENKETLLNFEFKDHRIENGFQNFNYANRSDNPCDITGGSQQSYLWGTDANGDAQTIKLYYSSYNTDHMGWLRWGFLDVGQGRIENTWALKLILTGGAYDEDGEIAHSGLPVKSKEEYQNFLSQGQNPHADRSLPGDATLYFKTRTATTPFPQLQGKNRLAMWVKFPRGKGIEDQKYSQNYRRPDFTFSLYPFIDTAKGKHYYHGVTNIPMGGWTRIEFDPHPYHSNAGDKNSYAHYPCGADEAPGDGMDYFSRIVTFALRAQGVKNMPSPTAISIDDIQAYRVDNENDETISSMGIGFNPHTLNFDLSLTDKYRGSQCNGVYEVRYSFAPITQANFPRASLCHVLNFNRKQNNDQGLVYKPNKGYNQVWAGLALKAEDRERLREGAVVYFAVQDKTDRSHLAQRDPNDDAMVEVPGVGPVWQTDLIRTLAYPIHCAPTRPLKIKESPSRYWLSQNQKTTIHLTPVGGNGPYGFQAIPSLPKGLKIANDGTLSGIPEEAGTHQFDIRVTDSMGQSTIRSITLEMEPDENDELNGDPSPQPQATSHLLVDFGNGPDQNRFGIHGWETIIKDRYTGYMDEGTTIVVGSNKSYDFQGVSGPDMTLTKGSTIEVTWKNTASKPICFTPQISFSHRGRPLYRFRDQWQKMSPLTLAPGARGVSRYEMSAGQTIQLVNVNVNFSHRRQLICDKIQLTKKPIPQTGVLPPPSPEGKTPAPVNPDTAPSLLVDFGNGPDQNRFGIQDWDTIIKDRYTGYMDEGTTIVVGSNKSYDFQGVSGPDMTLTKGSTIEVTWKNTASKPICFTPQISFSHRGRPLYRFRDQWQKMSPLTLAPGAKGVSRYEMSADQTIQLVNVNVNVSHRRQLICDKIQLRSTPG